MCEYCKFKFNDGQEKAKPFEKGVGIQAHIFRDDDTYFLRDGDEYIIISCIRFCQMCGRKLEKYKENR